MTKESEPQECKHCNGFGSSFKEHFPKCSKCGGSGLEPGQDQPNHYRLTQDAINLLEKALEERNNYHEDAIPWVDGEPNELHYGYEETTQLLEDIKDTLDAWKDNYTHETQKQSTTEATKSSEDGQRNTP